MAIHIMIVAYCANFILGSADVNMNYVKSMIELISCYAGDNVKVSANDNGNANAASNDILDPSMPLAEVLELWNSRSSSRSKSLPSVEPNFQISESESGAAAFLQESDDSVLEALILKEAGGSAEQLFTVKTPIGIGVDGEDSAEIISDSIATTSVTVTTIAL